MAHFLNAEAKEWMETMEGNREKKEKGGPQTEHSFSEAKKVFQKMNCQKSLKLTFSYLLFLPEKTFK